METLKRFVIFVTLLIGSTALADSEKYIFSDRDISVRVNSSPRSAQLTTIQPGESFKIIKWNRHNTRIQLSDGRIGFIDKEVVESFAPADDVGYLPKPLSLVSTHDEGYSPKNYDLRSLIWGKGGQGGGEVVSSDPDDDARDEDGVIMDANDNSQEQATPGISSASLNKLSKKVWGEAIEKRRVANMCGGGFRSGNRSKCYCAAAVKDTLKDMGICTSRFDGVNARNLEQQNLLRNNCPGLSRTSGLDPLKAKGASLIVYSGYAGRVKHNEGHVEWKIPVTEELKRTMGKQSAGLTVGKDFLYCSDFCANHPTHKATNKVIGIYQLNGV